MCHARCHNPLVTDTPRFVTSFPITPSTRALPAEGARVDGVHCVAALQHTRVTDICTVTSSWHRHFTLLTTVLTTVETEGPNCDRNTFLDQILTVRCLYQALRICLEWSSEAIYFSTHHFELIYHKIFFKTNSINSLLTKSLTNFLKTFFYYLGI